MGLSIFFGIWPIFPILYALFRDAGFSCEATPAAPAAKGPACLSQRPRHHCLGAPGICSSDAGTADAANTAGSRCSAAGYFAASNHGYLLQGGVRSTDAAVCSHSTLLQDVPRGACRTLSSMDSSFFGLILGRPGSASCSYRLTMEDIEYEDIQSSLANLESGSDSKSPPKSFRSRRMSMMGRAQMVQMQGQLPQVASPRTHARTQMRAKRTHAHVHTRAHVGARAQSLTEHSPRRGRGASVSGEPDSCCGSAGQSDPQ